MEYQKYKSAYYDSRRRGVDFEITFEEFCDLWKDKWELRGNSEGKYCLARINLDKGYTKDNLRVMPFSEAQKYRSRKYKDDLTTKKYRAFVQQRNQANFRKEDWNMLFEEWQELWGDKFHLKGRSRESYVMTRLDPALAWSKDNCMVLQRKDQFKHANKVSHQYAIQTPAGVFPNQKAAAAHYGVDHNKIATWRDENPLEFYYINIETKRDKRR